MSLFLIIVLSVVLVIDCTILVFLVLMQLPKKEAGAGLAFGGAATDALFGAGSGNFLTKATKYTAGIFFALAIILSVLQSYRAHRPGSEFEQRIKAQQNVQPTIAAPPAPTTPAPAPSTSQPATAPANSNLLLVPQVEKPATTNGPSSTAPVATTNVAPAK
jgi:preprotein translocase subunit SecG